MKRFLLLLLALGVAASLNAVGQFGAALDMSLGVDGRNIGYSKGTHFSLDFQPSFIIKLDASTQLEPFIGLGYNSYSNPDANPAIPWGNNIYDFSFRFGAGLYTFPVKADRWSFGTGAKLTIAFGTPFVTSIEVPFIIEFALTENVHIRISHLIAGMALNVNSSGSGPSLNETDTFSFYTFTRGFNPYFGLSFYF